jgi:hypothetical protein
MTTEVLLWIGVGIAALIYRWVGKVLISQHRMYRPPIFYNESVATAAIAASPIAFIAIIVAGFWLTDIGWYYVAAIVVLCGVFAVRPHAHR